jgi:hypothetical protein
LLGRVSEKIEAFDLAFLTRGATWIERC